MADWLASKPMLFRFVDIALATPRQAGPRKNPKEPGNDPGRGGIAMSPRLCVQTGIVDIIFSCQRTSEPVSLRERGGF